MERRVDFNPSVIWIGGDAFVQIINVELKGIVADLSLEIKVINKHNSNLKKIDYQVNFYNSAEMKIQEEPYEVKGEDIDIKCDHIGLASKLRISDTYPEARRAEVKLLKAYFADGNSVDLVYDKMEKFALENLKDDEIEVLKKVAGRDAICLPAQLKANWRCVCGYFNGNESESCNNCKRKKKQIFTDYKSIEQIVANIEKEILGEIDTLDSNIEEIESKKEVEKILDAHLKEDIQPPIENIEPEEEIPMEIPFEESIKQEIEEVEEQPKVEKKKKENENIAEIKKFIAEASRLRLTLVFLSSILIITSLLLFLTK